MIRCIILVAACIVLHVAQPSVLELVDNLHFANAQTASFVLYVKWGLALWAVSDCNAALNRWAENRWVWNPDTSDRRWKNEVAVVTGGSNGIGACVARELATYGIKVAVLDVVPLSKSFTAGMTCRVK
jgi:all-trans-retinol dehydrogenase (NAD+)